MGGEQVVPMDVRRVRIHKSVKIIPAWAFNGCRRLIYVEFHNGIKMIEEFAFGSCTSLRRIKLLGVKVIGVREFANCSGLRPDIRKRARKEICVTSGASIVIKNVFPFMELK